MPAGGTSPRTPHIPPPGHRQKRGVGTGRHGCGGSDVHSRRVSHEPGVGGDANRLKPNMVAAGSARFRGLRALALDAGSRLRLWLGGRRRPHHAQVTTAADLNALADGLGDCRARLRRAGRPWLGHRLGEQALAARGGRPHGRRSRSPRGRRPAPALGQAAAAPRPNRAAPPAGRHASRTDPRSADRHRPQAARVRRSSPCTRM